MELMNQLITNYGYIAIFIVLALGLFSLPIPDEITVLVGGYLTKNGMLQFPLALIVVFIGSLFGMMISYYIGKQAGRPAIEWIQQKLKLSPKWIYHAEALVVRYGSPAIIVSFFIPGMRHLAGYFCGISKMSITSYTLYAAGSAFVWGMVFLLLGRVF